jgi:Na+-transporting NADH:ubiquinone oxidoreductase subunit NqrE
MDTLYTKLGAFAAAVAMNAAIMAGVVYLFALQGHPHFVGLA